MVTMEEEAKKKKPKPRGQRVTDEFKTAAIAMVLDEGRSPESVAKDLGLSRSTFFRWVRQARIDRGEGKGELTSEERRRLMQLERENRQLKVERELLKKWVAFSAKEMSK